MDYLNHISLLTPKKVCFGNSAVDKFIDDILSLTFTNLFILSIPALEEKVQEIANKLTKNGKKVKVAHFDAGEPTFSDFDKNFDLAQKFGADAVIGIGGGSVLDLAKVIAALLNTETGIGEIVGNGLIKKRESYLICIPTTSGTGSEMSPNSILMDNENAKKGIISPFLVPDASYIDPMLTINLPPSITAFTGIDALTHCLEAYTNKYAHPLVDMYALEGIRLIGNNLERAVTNGNNLEARYKVAQGSMYGGMCLGPVNTAAVHALAYPLGSMFKMPHGLSNAVLLPYVMEYNLVKIEDKYANIGLALGSNRYPSNRETAISGIEMIKSLISKCGISLKLSEYKITINEIDEMAEGAYQVQRLLKNNIRELKINDIKNIYKAGLN